MNILKIPTLRESYKQIMAEHISVIIDDLTPNEISLIEKSFDLFEAKMEEIKLLEDSNKRLTIDLLNMKAILNDRNDKHKKYEDDEEE